MMKSFVIRVGGEAGKGIASAADILAGVFLRLGYNVFSSKDYASQIKGGHNYHTLRISGGDVGADVSKVDVLLAFDESSLKRHLAVVKENGLIITDVEIDFGEIRKVRVKEIEEKLSQKNLDNALFLGIAVKSLGIEFTILKEVLENYFSRKLELKEILIKAAEESYNNCEEWMNLEKLDGSNKEFLNGNEALVKGALDAGLGFHVQYPMTPVSGMLHLLAKEAVDNSELIVVQPEDEIAAINIALGASFAGKRAMTATSGGGFALMVESLGLAGMAEIPLVVVEGQRPGPATGLPTKTEQGDLKFVLNSGGGDFPLVVLAPGDVDECYVEIRRAFYLAEKYFLPVVVLVDKQITESSKTVDFSKESFDFDGVVKIVEDVDLNEEGLFKRYAVESRTIPGVENGMYTCAGDEHDEVGCITEDKEIRIRMMDRRMGKLRKVSEELVREEIFGDNEGLLVVGWGSTKGAIKEAVSRLQGEGCKIGFLQIKNMAPFLSLHIEEIIGKFSKVVLIENNYSGQLGDVIREKTGVSINDRLLKYDGSNFTVDEIYDYLRGKING